LTKRAPSIPGAGPPATVRALNVAGAVASLEVVDDGVGFDPDAVVKRVRPHGDAGRGVAQVGGSVSVHSGSTGQPWYGLAVPR